MNTTYTAEQMEAIDAKYWEHPNGAVRYYINDWETLAKLEVHRYHGSGNISAATLDGDKVSNAEAGRLLDTKVWWDDTDERIHVRNDGDARGADTLEELIHAGIAAAVAEVEANREAKVEAEPQAEVDTPDRTALLARIAQLEEENRRLTGIVDRILTGSTK